MFNAKHHEITIPLLSGQTTLVFSPRDVVSDLLADLVVGYYAGEDVPGGAPYKIALKPSLQTLFEVSLTEIQFIQMLKHLAGWLKNRMHLPHSISDSDTN